MGPSSIQLVPRMLRFPAISCHESEDPTLVQGSRLPWPGYPYPGVRLQRMTPMVCSLRVMRIHHFPVASVTAQRLRASIQAATQLLNLRPNAVTIITYKQNSSTVRLFNASRNDANGIAAPLAP